MEIGAKQCNECNNDNILLPSTQNQNTKKISLNLSMESDNQLFVADQTPTPTCLIKNCEEVGLFDDLQNVNPFEETFRRAVQQNAGQTPAALHTEADPTEDSLHTPQVFPQLDVNPDNNFRNGCELLSASSVTTSLDDLLNIDNTFKFVASRQNSINDANNSQLYKLKNFNELNNNQNLFTNSRVQLVQLPAAVRVVQPQIITLNLTANSLPAINLKSTVTNSNNSCNSSNTSSSSQSASASASAIPVQTVKPFIYPKPAINSNTKVKQNSITATITPTTTATTHIPTTPEPSSASLTPTSQLPIKERLKAILNTSSKCRLAEQIQILTPQISSFTNDTTNLSSNTCNRIERKRAASSRYRHKIRNEQQQLQRQNAELRAENTELRTRLRQLEARLTAKQSDSFETGGVITVPTQIQIPSTSIQLVMNIPKLTVPLAGQAQILNTFNYNYDKK